MYQRKMGGWGNYAITQVRYWDEDEEDDRLKHVKRRDIDDGTVGEAKVARRRSVLMDLRSGEDYVTALEEDGKLKLQEQVRLAEDDDGTEYLRVDDGGDGDDLGGLPTF